MNNSLRLFNWDINRKILQKFKVSKMMFNIIYVFKDIRANNSILYKF